MKLQHIYDNFVKGYSDPNMRNVFNFLTYIVSIVEPKHILELGTGTGKAVRMMMQSLPRTSRLTTIGDPCKDDTGADIGPWKSDKRLALILGDTTDPALRDEVYGVIDFLFINSDAPVDMQWDIWKSFISDCAVVVVNNAYDTDFSWGYDNVKTSVDFQLFRCKRPR